MFYILIAGLPFIYSQLNYSDVVYPKSIKYIIIIYYKCVVNNNIKLIYVYIYKNVQYNIILIFFKEFCLVSVSFSRL